MKKLLTVFALLQACVDPIALESIQHDDALVVEGHISTEFKGQQIKLSRTSPLNDARVIPEQHAIVQVKDSEGTIFDTTEVSPGVYITSPFSGTVGRGYQLLIQTEKDRAYTSGEVVLNDVPEIGSIYAQYPSPEAKSFGTIRAPFSSWP